MGKSSPKPPPAPDPTVLSNAQSAANKDTADYQSVLNNTNVQGPYGSVQYTQAPSGQWTQTTTLSPQEQQVFDWQTEDQRKALKLGDAQLGRVATAVSTPLQAPTLQTSGPPVGDLATGYDPGGAIQYSFDPGGPIATGFNSGGPIQSQVAPTYSPFSSLGGPHGPGGSSGTSLATGAQPAGQGAGPNASLAAMASNPVLGTQLATYAQARQMLDPQWSQAGEQTQAQLVAQGLNPNDAAYQNAMQIFGNQQNQAYDQALFNAINAGAAEQNTLFGQNLSAGQFANAAQQQGYNENLGQAQFANQSQAQQYGENQGLAQLNNAAQAQANSQNAQAAAFRNAAMGQGWQEQYANAQLANQAAQQQFQDQAYAQELPINEFNALMSSGQVSAPTSSPAQTSVAPTNVLGAYQLQQAALQNNYDAQMQNNQSNLGGLFSLGSAALNFL